MVANKKVNVEVAYATKTRQIIIDVEVPEHSTIEQTILTSTILELFPEIDLEQQKVGIFSQLKKLHDVVNAGDRIEIYRPLTMDPKQSRRLKAINAKKLKS